MGRMTRFRRRFRRRLFSRRRRSRRITKLQYKGARWIDFTAQNSATNNVIVIANAPTTSVTMYDLNIVSAIKTGQVGAAAGVTAYNPYVTGQKFRIVGIDMQMAVFGHVDGEVASSVSGGLPSNVYSGLSTPRVDTIMLGWWKDFSNPPAVGGYEVATLNASGRLMWGGTGRWRRAFKIIKKWTVTKNFTVTESGNSSGTFSGGTGTATAYHYFTLRCPGYYKRIKWRGSQQCLYNTGVGGWWPVDLYLMTYSNTAYNFGANGNGRQIEIEGRVYYQDG